MNTVQKRSPIVERCVGNFTMTTSDLETSPAWQQIEQFCFDAEDGGDQELYAGPENRFAFVVKGDQRVKMPTKSGGLNDWLKRLRTGKSLSFYATSLEITKREAATWLFQIMAAHCARPLNNK